MLGKDLLLVLAQGTSQRAHIAQVTAILVLHGLPHLVAGAILGHEIMHAWLHLSGMRHLSSDVEEGICQLMALLWLEKQAVKVYMQCFPCHFVQLSLQQDITDHHTPSSRLLLAIASANTIARPYPGWAMSLALLPMSL